MLAANIIETYFSPLQPIWAYLTGPSYTTNVHDMDKSKWISCLAILHPVRDLLYILLHDHDAHACHPQRKRRTTRSWTGRARTSPVTRSWVTQSRGSRSWRRLCSTFCTRKRQYFASNGLEDCPGPRASRLGGQNQSTENFARSRFL